MQRQTKLAFALAAVLVTAIVPVIFATVGNHNYLPGPTTTTVSTSTTDTTTTISGTVTITNQTLGTVHVYSTVLTNTFSSTVGSVTTYVTNSTTTYTTITCTVPPSSAPAC